MIERKQINEIYDNMMSMLGDHFGCLCAFSPDGDDYTDEVLKKILLDIKNLLHGVDLT